MDSKLRPIDDEPAVIHECEVTGIPRKVVHVEIRPLLYGNSATRPIRKVLMCSIDD